MLSVQSPFVSMALVRLRRGVTVCCWTVGAALLAQVLIWCIASFTEARSETLKDTADPTSIVSAASQPSSAAVAPAVTQKTAFASTSKSRGVDPNRVISRLDPVLAVATSFALAVGTLAALVLLLVLAMGVLLGVSSSTNGVEDVVASFLWGAFIAILILPIGTQAGLPWTEGALTSYALMTQSVEAAMSDRSWGNPSFYARFAAMPLTCVAVLAIVGWKFHAGVRAGIIVADTRLDPLLEKETAGIRPSSLHGGRAGRAMRAAVSMSSMDASGLEGPVTQVTAGKSPPRLI